MIIYLKVSKNKLLAKYPMLKDKKIILYAPTFRGNIYQGFSMLPFDGEKLINSFDENTYLIYKLHPLFKKYFVFRNTLVLLICLMKIHMNCLL